MNPEKKKPKFDEVWGDARELIRARKGRLALGLLLMLISRLAGLVMPASSKYVIDEVIGKGHYQIL
ncbi:MAG TPA: ABC transporter ATP-binding protein, partial [Thermoanaerobaculia bacterium]